jgi:tRNA A-37 threonylcarbamoyl transferase component Bud32
LPAVSIWTPCARRRTAVVMPRETEARRLGELQAQGVNVPDVLGTGHAALVIGDNGSSFNTCLREADEAGRDRLVMAAMQAIAEAHARGAYFGQPLPRNLTWDGRRSASSTSRKIRWK